MKLRKRPARAEGDEKPMRTNSLKRTPRNNKQEGYEIWAGIGTAGGAGFTGRNQDSMETTRSYIPRNLKRRRTPSPPPLNNNTPPAPPRKRVKLILGKKEPKRWPTLDDDLFLLQDLILELPSRYLTSQIIVIIIIRSQPLPESA